MVLLEDATIKIKLVDGGKHFESTVIVGLTSWSATGETPAAAVGAAVMKHTSMDESLLRMLLTKDQG
jgi:hypothetical protein